MNIFFQEFQTGEAVKGGNVPGSTLQTWIRRGRIIGQRASGEEVEGAGSPGHYRRFSFRNIIEIAIAKALIDCGMKDIDAAFRVAMHYAHAGNEQRIPGMPHHWSEGRTLIGYSAETDRITDDIWKPGHDVYLNLIANTGGRSGIIILDFSEVFQSVCDRLGLDAAQQLDRAYNYSPEVKG